MIGKRKYCIAKCLVFLCIIAIQIYAMYSGKGWIMDLTLSLSVLLALISMTWRFAE